MQKILGTLLYLVIFIKTTRSGAPTHSTARTRVHELPFVGVLPDRFYRAILNYQPCKRWRCYSIENAPFGGTTERKQMSLAEPTQLSLHDLLVCRYFRNLATKVRKVLGLFIYLVCVLYNKNLPREGPFNMLYFIWLIERQSCKQNQKPRRTFDK